MKIGRLCILISGIVLFMLPFITLATDQTVDEFINALTPKGEQMGQDGAGAEKITVRTRGLGGMHAVAEKPEVTLHLPFDLNSHELKPEAAATLKKLGAALESESLKGYVFRIEGHTCDLGTDAYNMNLSNQRAGTVRDFLAENFSLSQHQFEVAWFGESQPAVPNDNEEARQQNRRVVIINTLKTLSLPVSGEGPAVLQVKCLKNGQEQTVRDGDTLDEKDRYAVEFKTQAMRYVYVFQVDEGGGITQLFPNKDFSGIANPVEPNQVYRVPAELRWFFLDKNKGKEQIVLLADEKPVDDPKGICMAALEKKYMAGKTRGVGGIRQETPGQKNTVTETRSSTKISEGLAVVMRHFFHR